MAPPVRRPGARATDKRISARASPATHALGPRGGADHGETVLHFAVVKNDLQMVQLLLDCGAHPDQAHANGLFFYERIEMYMGGSPIGFAACLDDRQIVEYLLTNPHCQADVNCRDGGPISPSLPLGDGMCRNNSVPRRLLRYCSCGAARATECLPSTPAFAHRGTHITHTHTLYMHTCPCLCP